MPSETECLEQSHMGQVSIPGFLCFPSHQMVLVDLFELEMTHII